MNAQKKLEAFFDFFMTITTQEQEDNVFINGIVTTSRKEKLVKKNGRFFKKPRYFEFYLDLYLSDDKTDKNAISFELRKKTTADEKTVSKKSFFSFDNYSEISDERVSKIFEVLNKYLFVRNEIREGFENYLSKKEMVLKLESRLVEKNTKTKVVKI